MTSGCIYFFSYASIAGLRILLGQVLHMAFSFVLTAVEYTEGWVFTLPLSDPHN